MPLILYYHECIFQFRAYGTNGRNTETPHLGYTTNTTQFDIALENLTTNFPNSRFGLEMVLITYNTSDTPGGCADLKSTRSIDDEHSPGVFEVDMLEKNSHITDGCNQ